MLRISFAKITFTPGKTSATGGILVPLVVLVDGLSTIFYLPATMGLPDTVG